MGKGSLESRRVRLRALEPNDAPALFEAVRASRDPLKRRLSWVSSVGSVEDERRFIEEAARDGARFVRGVFDIRSDLLIGTASLEEMEAPSASRARLALWVAEERRDKGLGSEAARLLVEHAFRRLNLHRLFARVDPANRAYRRVLKKIGFKYEGCLRADRRLNGRWIDQECWGLLRGEWKR